MTRSNPTQPVRFLNLYDPIRPDPTREIPTTPSNPTRINPTRLEIPRKFRKLPDPTREMDHDL